MSLLLLCQDSDFGLDGKRIWACLVANKVERPSSEISLFGHDHVHKLSKDVSALSPFFNWYKILTASSRVKPRFIVGFMVNKNLVHNHDSRTFSRGGYKHALDYLALSAPAFSTPIKGVLFGYQDSSDSNF